MGRKTVLFLAAFLLAGPWSAAGENGVSVHGGLGVEGTRLVDAHGAPLQLRGMSSHGLHWFPEYINIGAMLTTKKYGANLFRLAMYADSNHGAYNDGEAGRDLNRKLLRLGMENALAADMYVIVDWHILEDGNPMATVESAELFFEEISRLYADQPAVLYEICNEPNGETSWSDIVQYANRIIPIIRKNSPNAVILVGTPHLSSRPGDALAAPLPYENIMYVYHFYTEFHDSIPRDMLDSLLEAGMPIFVTEWGLGRQEGDAGKAAAFVDYMREKNISWANWSLCNKDEGFSAIKPDVSRLSGWTMDDLTVSGRLVFSALAGSAP